MWRRQGKVSFTPIEVVGNDEPMLETLCDVVVCITGRFTVWFRMLFNEYFHWMLIHIFWLVTRINQMLLSMNNSVFDWVHTSFLKQQLVLPSKVLTCHVQIPMLCGHRRQRVALVPTSLSLITGLPLAPLFCQRFHWLYHSAICHERRLLGAFSASRELVLWISTCRCLVPLETSPVYAYSASATPQMTTQSCSATCVGFTAGETQRRTHRVVTTSPTRLTEPTVVLDGNLCPRNNRSTHPKATG